MWNVWMFLGFEPLEREFDDIGYTLYYWNVQPRILDERQYYMDFFEEIKRIWLLGEGDK